jgi:hypothetical protein
MFKKFQHQKKSFCQRMKAEKQFPSVEEQLAKLRKLESEMSYEELRQFKLQQLRPTRTRNLALAGLIWTGILAVCKLTLVY